MISLGPRRSRVLGKAPGWGRGRTVDGKATSLKERVGPASTVQLRPAGEETGAGIQPPESKDRAAAPVNCNCTEVEEWALMISAQTLFCPSISAHDRRFKVPLSEVCIVLLLVRLAVGKQSTCTYFLMAIPIANASCGLPRC